MQITIGTRYDQRKPAITSRWVIFNKEHKYSQYLFTKDANIYQANRWQFYDKVKHYRTWLWAFLNRHLFDCCVVRKVLFKGDRIFIVSDSKWE